MMCHYQLSQARSPNDPLASRLKTQLREEHPPSRPSKPRQSKIKKRQDPMETLARRVSRKIDAGDLRGAIRLASSNETLADYDDSTFSALQSKHSDSTIPSSVTPRATFDVPASVITRAIRSFPNGSAGGLDKLQPQHLKDLLASVDDIEESPLFLPW